MRSLFITQPGDGHLNPLVPLARALRSAGHQVLFAVAQSYLDDVTRLGLPAVAAGADYRWDAALQRWPECVNHMGTDSPAFWVETVNRDITVPLVHDLRRIVAEFRPNLLVARSRRTWSCRARGWCAAGAEAASRRRVPASRSTAARCRGGRGHVWRIQRIEAP